MSDTFDCFLITVYKLLRHIVYAPRNGCVVTVLSSYLFNFNAHALPITVQAVSVYCACLEFCLCAINLSALFAGVNKALHKFLHLVI